MAAAAAAQPTSSDTEGHPGGGWNGIMEDHLKILIATDCHLGYCEKDLERGRDSMQTFEEILKLAQEHNVDCVLLGGDLFHDNRPSRRTMQECMRLLREYCMGDRPCAMEIVSDQSRTFERNFGMVNYESLDYNVSIPVFSIHGNHDDPTGEGTLSALDILSTANLVNYFGRADQVDKIEMAPILIKKGDAKLALYGLGNIRDERLYRTFATKQVKMLRPSEELNSWFNLMVLHQNRANRGPTNFIPESFIPDFVHAVVWGHEHDCEIEDVHDNTISSTGPRILQPGSSIATSLSEGESKPKHVMLLELADGLQYKLTSIPLQTVRPFLFRDIVLSELDGADPANPTATEKAVARVVKRMILQAKADAPPAAKGMLPLIRIRAEYTGFDTFSVHTFGRDFIGKVANPKDIVLFHRKARRAAPTRKTPGTNATADADDADDDDVPEVIRNDHIMVLVKDMLKEQKLHVLLKKDAGDAVERYVKTETKSEIANMVSESLDRAVKSLVSCGESDIKKAFKKVLEIDVKDADLASGPGTASSTAAPATSARGRGRSQTEAADKLFGGSGRKGRGGAKGRQSSQGDDDEDAAGVTRTEQRRSTARSAKRKKPPVIDDDDDDDASESDGFVAEDSDRESDGENDYVPPTKKKHGRSTAAAARTTKRRRAGGL
eukprot:m.1073852 g.1073852  ORF g.1073852 m.1073852 type:complete len:666 (-) comp24237_c0_seq10:481-2478(-)